MFFEFIFVDLQIVIPGCLYQLNLINLNEFDFLSFAGSHKNDRKYDLGRERKKVGEIGHLFPVS